MSKQRISEETATVESPNCAIPNRDADSAPSSKPSPALNQLEDGLFQHANRVRVTFDGDNDPAKAVNWTRSKKWTNMALLSTMSFITPLASSMFAPGVPQMLAEFDVDGEVLGSLVVSIYLLGYAAGPLLFAPFSELYGRATVYHLSNLLFIVFTVACAVSKDITTITVFRFFEGCFGAAVLSVGGGTVSDLFEQEQRGRALAVWTIGPILGPCIGPVIGSFTATNKGWRWIFWVIAIAGGAVAIAFLLFLSETSSTVILRRKAARLQQQDQDSLYTSEMDVKLDARAAFSRAIFRPLRMLFGSLIVASMSTLAAVVYGYLYLLITTLTPVFEDVYGFSSDIVGLSYLGLGVGMLLGLYSFGMFSDPIIKQMAKRNGGRMKPEYRLPPMIFAGFGVPVGLFIYGWTAQFQVFWFVPIFGTALIGAGIIAYIMPIQAYLVDAFAIHAASALSAASVWRSIVGALLPLAGESMYNRLGFGWGNSLLGFIAVAMIPIPFLLLHFGERIRTNPRFQVQF